MQEFKSIQENKKIPTAVKPDNKMQMQMQKTPAKKKKKKISAAVVICILLILIIAGAGAAVYFNIGGTKQIVVSFLQSGASASASPQASGAVTQADLDAQTAALAQEKQTLDAKDKSLKQKEGDLNTKEQDIEKREASVTASENQISSDAQAKADLEASAKILEQMDAVKAAKAIGGMKTTQEMAQVLMKMSSDKAALIMNQMSASLATKISSEMIQ